MAGFMRLWNTNIKVKQRENWVLDGETVALLPKYLLVSVSFCHDLETQVFDPGPDPIVEYLVQKSKNGLEELATQNITGRPSAPILEVLINDSSSDDNHVAVHTSPGAGEKFGRIEAQGSPCPVYTNSESSPAADNRQIFVCRLSCGRISGRHGSKRQTTGLVLSMGCCSWATMNSRPIQIGHALNSLMDLLGGTWLRMSKSSYNSSGYCRQADSQTSSRQPGTCIDRGLDFPVRRSPSLLIPIVCDLPRSANNCSSSIGGGHIHWDHIPMARS